MCFIRSLFYKSVYYKKEILHNGKDEQYRKKIKENI
jgi:hypothetical protein